MHVFDGADVMTLPVKRHFERVQLSSEVIFPSPLHDILFNMYCI